MKPHGPKRTVTSHDIARRAGVSQPTVSRVLTGNDRVNPEARSRVLAAARELKYRPNGNARAMRTSRTGNVGVVVSRLTNPLYPEMLEAIGQHLTSHSLRMVMWSTDELDERIAIDAMYESLVDGVIMTTATDASSRLYETLQLNAPVVLINRSVERWPCDQVTSDNCEGGALVAHHFVEAGRQRIGLMGGPAAASTIRERQSGFRLRLDSMGATLPPTHCIDVKTFSYQQGFAAAKELLGRARQRLDAVFCVNDILAIGAMDAARSLGLSIPGDLWVVGYDDIEQASWESFNLTTVRQPLGAMADQTIRFLLDRMAGHEGVPRRRSLPNELIVRASTSS
ncbi:LacI family DNA-binding transcriptional regulator [Burkholderia sp. SCN-KJ]|uniref:LacI family DNA-binding transcriptional regulator n=1 Tax=Burkholderia sp. SCN-KJ TaxID=2969248 RepID=UPI0021505EE4|nr:LacI family DNA-binding transcriptional regulator [Burkholderia sp. SCN-KJ]MCR4470462.1 LacI family transcriptional regulator [Burkholderia sp. SCN-KJ]